ncbi:MAG: DNA polymerase III subunit gamma/tau [Caulobacteraceae bacterium]|nr:DNA polymerase III subunit gamma/tau [Caulobacter sp.]
MSDIAPWDELEGAPEPEPAERDPDTDDMFGAPAEPAAQAQPATAPPVSGAPAAYQVLARKYRPRTFEDLIGQEAMVRTLSNAFHHDRIAHAFMLTGVRGVGKTTTARLLARALNYETDVVRRPSVDLKEEGRHCRAIIEGRHMDVLELDAASRTKVDEMRELLDSVRYAPVEARYKVYVIDEVHMLSTAAFNALLKTLEEPPPHAKFVFATTEIRKVPVTILSRTQRFDLRRVEPEVLSAHLGKVAAAEGASLDDEALALLARAAEGSVRDGLSLLDQAIVQGEDGAPVDAALVRDMLGLADRTQTIALFEHVMAGRAAEALTASRTLYGFGAEPAVVMGDLLEHAHAAALAKTLGEGALHLPKDQAAAIGAIGARASAGALSRVWQMLLKAHDEVRRAPDPLAALEMALIRVAYAADLPAPEDALKALAEGRPAPDGPGSPGGGGARMAAAGGGGSVAAYGAPTPAPVHAPRAQAAAAPMPETFAAVLALAHAHKEFGLKHDLERFVRPVSVRAGAIAFALEEGAPRDLAQRLSARLKSWTGRPWLMDVRSEAAEGEATVLERDRRDKAAAKAALHADPFVRAVLEHFPGAQVVETRKAPPPLAAAAPATTPDDEGEAAPVTDDEGSSE